MQEKAPKRAKEVIWGHPKRGGGGNKKSSIFVL